MNDKNTMNATLKIDDGGYICTNGIELFLSKFMGCYGSNKGIARFVDNNTGARYEVKRIEDE
tara:strand:- start:3602 stop:3787 length:186 start_codon:yes stop_codon:yes gene_type:complete